MLFSACAGYIISRDELELVAKPFSLKSRKCLFLGNENVSSRTCGLRLWRGENYCIAPRITISQDVS